MLAQLSSGRRGTVRNVTKPALISVNKVLFLGPISKNLPICQQQGEGQWQARSPRGPNSDESDPCVLMRGARATDRHPQ